jgi:protein-S-isoprenylcysteine O-methyltransferase Ste14
MHTNRIDGLRERVLGVLRIPWVDKIIAIAAASPFAYELIRLLGRGEMNIPRAVLATHYLLVVATMVFRIAPVRITANPWYWLLAFVASYQGLWAAAFIQKGTAIVPGAVSNSISILSLVVAAYARLSLGRNIGLVPAQRTIVTRGAYRFVRHPIYTGIFISWLAFVLRVYTPGNLVLVLVGCGLFVIKSFIEEGFLREDPEYAAYLARVRWRWFPGLA